MATQLTPGQQNAVDDFFRAIQNLRREVAQARNQADRIYRQNLLNRYIPDLRRRGVLPHIVDALEERVQMAESAAPEASAPSGPNGGRKSRKQSKKKRRSTRRKYLKSVR